MLNRIEIDLRRGQGKVTVNGADVACTSVEVKAGFEDSPPVVRLELPADSVWLTLDGASLSASHDLLNLVDDLLARDAGPDRGCEDLVELQARAAVVRQLLGRNLQAGAGRKA